MDASNRDSELTEITLDKTRTPRGRRGRLDLDAKEVLLRLYAKGEPTAHIADRFGIDETYVRKLASRYGIRGGLISMGHAVRRMEAGGLAIPGIRREPVAG